MNYLLLVVAGLAGIHGYTFARWLQKKGNYLGGVGVYLLIGMSLALSLYHMIQES